MASILFLGFLLPHSTGNDFYLLQFIPRERNFIPDEFILELDLEERLEKSVTTNLSAHQFGSDPLEALTDPDIDLTLFSFLDALEELLDHRPFHREQVDLLHLFAMAIHPITQPPKATSLFRDNPAWHKAVRLMQNMFALQFHIHSGHRYRIVRLVANHLVLPELNDVSRTVGPLLYGSLLHLRAALRAFSFAAAGHDARHAHEAHAALVNISVQTRNLLFMKEDWDFLLHLMVDDRADYHCESFCHKISTAQKTCDDKSTFCPHSARGELLANFIVGACASSSDAESAFFNHIASSLNDAIEWQTDCWTLDENHDQQDGKAHHAPCLLASLLFAASNLFYFCPNIKGENVNEDEDHDDPCTALIQTAIALLGHTNHGVIMEASRLLVQAYSYTGINVVDQCAYQLLQIINDPQSASIMSLPGSQVSSLIAAVSNKSPQFSLSGIRTLLDDGEGKPTKSTSYFLLPQITINCPKVAFQELDRFLLDVEKDALSANDRFQAVLASLPARNARIFVKDADRITSAVMGAFEKCCPNDWTKYQLARQAMVTGNFSLAASTLSSILSRSYITEIHFLWLSTLERVCTTEALLSAKGAMGIPQASKTLNAALSYLRSLGIFSTDWSSGGLFHVRFLLLRLDFLDLTVIIRQLVREMRLTGRLPSKNTRSVLHLRNIERGFMTLSSRYNELYFEYGALFRDNFSKVCMNILSTLCVFMASATRAVFFEILSPKSGQQNAARTENIIFKLKHPMAELMRRFHTLVVQPMDSSIDPMIRATAMLELINGVLMAPLPFPKDFLAPFLSSDPILHISADPTPIFDASDHSCFSIDTAPSLSFSVCVHGRLPWEALKVSAVPIRLAILWFRVVYKSPLIVDDEEHKDDETFEVEKKHVSRLPSLSSISPTVANLTREGRFFATVDCPPLLEEGIYSLKVRLGCRDIQGREWGFPISKSIASISVRASRSLVLL
jgi:hypothetical protein